jgi:hypothetical protein
MRKKGRTEEAEVIKRISPVAWRHVNLIGKFEFQKQHTVINIDEIIKTLQKEPGWQNRKLLKNHDDKSLILPFGCVEQK